MAEETVAPAGGKSIRRRLLTLPEVAGHLGVALRTLHTWIAEGRLAIVRIGPRTIRVLEDDLADFVERARSERGPRFEDLK